MFVSCFGCYVRVVPSVLVFISLLCKFVFCVELCEIIMVKLCQGTYYESVSMSVVCSVVVNILM